VSAQPTEDPAQEAELRANLTLASQLGATGTPLCVVGDRVINSAVGYDALKEAVEAARKKG
jgi:protein-disulfide isomerase